MLQRIVTVVSKAGYGSYNEILNTSATHVIDLYYYEIFLKDYENEVQTRWKELNDG